MSFAGKNLKYLRRLRGWTQDELAHQLDIKRSLVGAYEEERAEPRLEVADRVCSLFRITLEDFFLKELAQQSGNYLAQRRRMKMAADRGIIHFVPVKAAAGYLAGYNDPEFIEELNTFTLPMLGNGDFRAFEIVGDSMLPTPSGSVIVGEKVEGFEQVKPSSTYIVVSRTDGIVYKRIEKQGRTKNTLTLVSDNPNYPPYQMNMDDVAEIWQAQMVISRPAERPLWDVNQLSQVVDSLQQQVRDLKKTMR